MIILVVEGEYLIGLTRKLALAVAGHYVMGPAASADEALLLAQSEQPALAFVDINIIGDRDGINLARILSKRHGTTCIFLTEQPDLARAAKSVALGVVKKPYDPPALLTAVEIVAEIRAGRIPTMKPRHLELFC